MPPNLAKFIFSVQVPGQVIGKDSMDKGMDKKTTDEFFEDLVKSTKPRQMMGGVLVLSAKSESHAVPWFKCRDGTIHCNNYDGTCGPLNLTHGGIDYKVSKVFAVTPPN